MTEANTMRTDRLRALEAYIQEHKSATMVDLARHFQVSFNTVRRDVKELLRSGSVSKVYGGIVWNQDENIIPFLARSTVAIEEKQHIGRLAAELVVDGDTLYLDAGTTAVCVLPWLAERKNLVVISNSLLVYQEIQKYPAMSLISVGGLFSHKTRSFVGMSAVNGLSNFSIGKAFMSATGVSLAAGASNNSLHEAEIKRAVISRAGQVILLTDLSKLEHDAAISFCPLTRVNTWICSSRPPDAYVRFCRQQGIDLRY